MFDIQKVEIDWGGRKLTLETGRIARQADGAVLATYGETTVLATVVSQQEPKPGQDFFPLTVNYQEKYFAAGKIPGGFFKREGRPTEKETLTSRLIDRPIRPLFAEGFKNETQVVVTVLSHDLENDPDIVAMVAASAALTLSGVPFMGPIGGARVGYINGSYVLNPPLDQLKEFEARPRRRRHRRRGADGRIGGAGALRGRHARRRHVRPPRLPAGDRRDHPARRARRQGAARLRGRRPGGALRARPADRGGRPGPRLFDHRQGRAPRRHRRGQGEGDRGALPAGRRGRAVGAAGRRAVQEARKRDRPRPHPRRRQPHRRPRPEDRPPDRRRSRRAAAHPRLGAVHPRRDAGAGRRHARHRRRRADDRRLEGTYKETLHAALQFPALLGRRDRPHGLARPPRDRPRQARLARDPSDAAGEPRVPLHDPRRLRDHRVRTARPRWRRSAAPRWR